MDRKRNIRRKKMASVYDIAKSFILLDDKNDGEGITNLKTYHHS
jgi:hypothetical protein